jgi:hypothetical protein
MPRFSFPVCNLYIKNPKSILSFGFFSLDINNLILQFFLAPSSFLSGKIKDRITEITKTPPTIPKETGDGI